MNSLEKFRRLILNNHIDINEDVKQISYEIKAIEIIKEYIHIIKICNAHYICLNDEKELLSKEEYDLLKDVLKND